MFVKRKLSEEKVLNPQKIQEDLGRVVVVINNIFKKITQFSKPGALEEMGFFDTLKGKSLDDLIKKQIEELETPKKQLFDSLKEYRIAKGEMDEKPQLETAEKVAVLDAQLQSTLESVQGSQYLKDKAKYIAALLGFSQCLEFYIEATKPYMPPSIPCSRF